MMKEYFNINNHSFTHTYHSQERASQRGVGNQIIDAILTYGRCFLLQGLSFYTVERGVLPQHFSKQLQTKLDNIIVVAAENGQLILTCYRSKNAIKYLKKKSKILR